MKKLKKVSEKVFEEFYELVKNEFANLSEFDCSEFDNVQIANIVEFNVKKTPAYKTLAAKYEDASICIRLIIAGLFAQVEDEVRQELFNVNLN